MTPDIVVLTVRPMESDFRYPLAQELSALGHKVVYVLLQREPLVTDMTTNTTERWSLGRLLRYFTAMRRQKQRPVVFNSTNLAFPWLSIALRSLSGTRWCLDMHDRLLYNTPGLKGVRMAIDQWFLAASSDWIVHAAPNLQKLFPRSQHIGNGSSLTPLPKQDATPARVLVLASIDWRFDFDALAAAATACPNRQFEIHGRVHRGDTACQAQLEAIVSAHDNIVYSGPYSDVSLPELLSRYVVSFAPYKTDFELTGYIDPLRFYHCLASDVGIASMPIAQAIEMREHVEVVERIEDIDAALDRAMAKRHGPIRTWRQVAAHVSEILRSPSG